MIRSLRLWPFGGLDVMPRHLMYVFQLSAVADAMQRVVAAAVGADLLPLMAELGAEGYYGNYDDYEY